MGFPSFCVKIFKFWIFYNSNLNCIFLKQRKEKDFLNLPLFTWYTEELGGGEGEGKGETNFEGEAEMQLSPVTRESGNFLPSL